MAATTNTIEMDQEQTKGVAGELFALETGGGGANRGVSRDDRPSMVSNSLVSKKGTPLLASSRRISVLCTALRINVASSMTPLCPDVGMLPRTPL